MCDEETRIRKESEETVLSYKRKLGQMSSELKALMEKLDNALKKNPLLVDEIAETKINIGELREKIVSSVKMSLSYKNEQKKLIVTRAHALEATDSLRQQAELAKLISSLPQFISEFSYSEIANATCYFHPSLRINDISIYKGILHRTEVAIKLVKDPSEYKLEVRM